ncbi:hypothetical protein COCNU_14G004180 [Cocos nucifera]|uniref:Uncharacterized protein n=1 Tax=Cocos nucifera TaxID=13894 RepID=A0A8K0IUR4_COCNU|nr:hypothetical protein COCNU_14G004180 [Cocos nucifera]
MTTASKHTKNNGDTSRKGKGKAAKKNSNLTNIAALYVAKGGKWINLKLHLGKSSK